MVLENKILVKVVESSYMAGRCINSSKLLLGKIAIQSLFSFRARVKNVEKIYKKIVFLG